jgi:hypothetical protein
MQETWTQYEAASAALVPRQWQLIDDAQNRNLKSSTSTPDSSQTSSSSGSSCYSSGYDNNDQYFGQLLISQLRTLKSPKCPKPTLCESENMSDPFAVRMNFKRAYLDKLTSSPATQVRAATYALKYREQDEDLHSCILEQLDAVRTPSTTKSWTRKES